jgi:hypothetical protein
MSRLVLVEIYRDLDPMERWERYHEPLDAPGA